MGQWMKVVEPRTGRAPHRRRRRLARSRRGVISVVGTLLALLVFFALFGIFVTQYVPVWMNSNEAAYSAQAQAAFADLKSNIDLQAQLAGPPTLATPVPLASQGIPLIAAPTTAVLNYVPHTFGVYSNVSMQFGPSGKPNFVYNVSLGTVALTIPNRYFTPESFEYEDDAVIESQGAAQQVLLYPPLFAVNGSGAYHQVTLGLLQLYGNATQIVSAGTAEVYSHWGTVQSFPSNGSRVQPGAPFNVTWTIGTLFPCAWITFLNATLSKSILPASSWSFSPNTCSAVAGNQGSTAIHVSFKAISTFILEVTSVTIATGVGQG